MWKRQQKGWMQYFGACLNKQPDNTFQDLTKDWESSVSQLSVDGLGGRSFQSWMAGLPIKERGMGLRSMVDTMPAAFIGSVEMSLPFLTGEGGQCQLLLPEIGDIRGAEEGSRWLTLLQSGSRTGREFRECWGRLQHEARQCSDYLGERLESHLSVSVQGLGEGRTDGSTRHLVTEQRERLEQKFSVRMLTCHVVPG